MYSKHLNTWLAALIAGFLVLVLPSCWHGAQALNLQGHSSSNNNEEREEHEHRDEEQRQARGTRPQPSRPARGSAHTSAPRIVAATRTSSILVASVAPVPHPAQFSIRRLR